MTIPGDARARRRGSGRPTSPRSKTATCPSRSAELEAEASEEAARAFIASGVEKGDRVAIWAPNGWRWEIAALGLLSAGAVLVTLNTRFKATEAAYVLEEERHEDCSSRWASSSG